VKRKKEFKGAKGKVVSLSISETKGQRKGAVPQAELRKNFGIVGDAHAGGKRQVSFLAQESIDKMREKGLVLKPGDFAENITTKGVDLTVLSIGSKIRLGDNALLEVSHIGKECHARCAIYYQAGDCIMPTEGVFARVLKGGIVKPGDVVETA